MVKILCHYFRDENRRILLSTQKINLVIDCYFSYVLTFKQLVPLSFAPDIVHFIRKQKAHVEEKTHVFILKKYPIVVPVLKRK
jgi:hypothetical protein